VRPNVFLSSNAEICRHRLVHLVARAAIFLTLVQPARVLILSPANANPLRALVRWVNDGDTIVLAGGERVRYVGINAPEIAHGDESAEPYGVAALNFNRKIVLGRWINLELAEKRRDHYGRLLAYVFLEDGTFVNGELIRQGYAHLLRRQAKLRYWERLLNLQRQALQEKRGIWSLPVVDPEEFYFGNKSSWAFHRPHCQFGLKTAVRNRVRFRDLYEALYQGFSPGRHCKP
jgi:endonuclease YncB( thermonuclease family)